MDLPRPKVRDLARYFDQFARDSMPKGACQHSASNSRLWKIKREKTGEGACFALSGSCQGPLDQVIAIGLNLAQDAIESNDSALAERIIARIESVKIEYEVAERELELERLQARYDALLKAEAIVAKGK